MKSLLPILWVLVATASLCAAANAPSIEQGKKLFNSTSLGTNGKSCAGCHRDGNGLDLAAGKDEASLAAIINRCIRMPLKGKALASDSSDLKSLIMYLQTVGNVRK